MKNSINKVQGKKAIGILGGMGPQASVYMHKTLIELSMRYFGAKNNDDFPEIILHSIPVPDFISNDSRKKQALIMLEKRVLELNRLPLTCLGIACNTAHILLPSLQKVSKVPFVSMIDEVVSSIPSSIQTVGILGTPSTIRFRLYQEQINKSLKKILVPSEKQIQTLEKVIRNVIAGKMLASDTIKLRNIAISLQKKGAQGIILGCTELPLAFPKSFSVPVFNSVEILAMSLLRNYYQ